MRLNPQPLAIKSSGLSANIHQHDVQHHPATTKRNEASGLSPHHPLDWRLVALGIGGILLSLLLLSFSDLPDTEELENPKSELASEIIADDGSVLGRYFIENRVPVDFSELSPFVEQALVATEDERYYSHSGIDFRALGRSFVKTFMLGDKSSGGASTITQQLAKLLLQAKKRTASSGGYRKN
ncbi:MAG: transglycosylase domain-containing protein [Saprospiraceae bacterium]|nr:transglycosylase domain-containing protein [Saprospiraceae bacterium]